MVFMFVCATDGGRTVHTDIPELNETMEKVGKLLNVRNWAKPQSTNAPFFVLNLFR